MRNLKERYEIVGFQDRLDEFLRALGTLFAMDPMLPTISPVNETGNYHHHVTADDLTFAEYRNALDMRLYAWAREEFLGTRRIESIAAPCRGRSYRKLSIGPGLFEVNVAHDGKNT